jgi:CheY-like chemotaxis protein
MKPSKRKLKVVVLDDSDFYNRLLTHELESYCKMLSLQFPVSIEIDSFSDMEMFLKRLEKSIDLAFVDFYLSSEMNGDEVTRRILEKNKTCKVVIISQSNSVPTSAKTRKSGATEFIHKDKYAIENACLSLHQYIMNKNAHA